MRPAGSSIRREERGVCQSSSHKAVVSIGSARDISGAYMSCFSGGKSMMSRVGRRKRQHHAVTGLEDD